MKLNYNNAKQTELSTLGRVAALAFRGDGQRVVAGAADGGVHTFVAESDGGVLCGFEQEAGARCGACFSRFFTGEDREERKRKEEKRKREVRGAAAGL